MKIRQTLKNALFSLGFIALPVMFGVVSPLVASADPPGCTPSKTVQCCGGVQTSILSCTQNGSGTDVSNTGLWGVLLIAINILTAGIGVAAVGGVVYGSILYTSAGGAPEQVKKARGIITNVVIGLVAYALMYAFLNFLIPGGLFN